MDDPPNIRRDPPSGAKRVYRGCLLGGAVGDALGAPVEFMSLAEIRATFGRAGITEFTTAFDRNDPPSGSLWVGVAGPSIKGNILSFGLDSLLGPSRPITEASGTVAR